MPLFNITIEDTSPLIRYSKNWRAGTSKDDGSADQYSQSSFTLTQAPNESMEFDFYGTAVTLYGAKRGNHGIYEAQLDGGSTMFANGSSSTFLFKQVMYTASGTLGSHKVVLKNTDNNFFDLDYITFQTNIGMDGEDLIVNTFQDNHPFFNYTPISSWDTPVDVGLFSGSTGHATTDSSAIATLNFKGDAIALYGSVGPNSTNGYTVTINGTNIATYSANKQFFRPRELLFYVGNLGLGEHSLQIRISSAELGELAIDYANVYTTPSLGGTFLAQASPDKGIQSPANLKIPTGIIIGLAFTSTLALLAIISCIYLLWMNKRKLPNELPTCSPFSIVPRSITSVPPHPEYSSTRTLSTAPISFTTVASMPSSAPLHSTAGTGGSRSAGGTSKASSSRRFRYNTQGKRNAAVEEALRSQQAGGGPSRGSQQSTQHLMEEPNPPHYTFG